MPWRPSRASRGRGGPPCGQPGLTAETNRTRRTLACESNANSAIRARAPGRARARPLPAHQCLCAARDQLAAAPPAKHVVRPLHRQPATRMESSSGATAAAASCLSCRVIGTSVCVGASGVLAAQLVRGVPPVGGPVHRAALGVFSAAFLVLGGVRAATP
jgi:hypothetical protein